MAFKDRVSSSVEELLQNSNIVFNLRTALKWASTLLQIYKLPETSFLLKEQIILKLEEIYNYFQIIQLETEREQFEELSPTFFRIYFSIDQVLDNYELLCAEKRKKIEIFNPEQLRALSQI